MMYNIRSGAIRWKKSDFLSAGNGNVYILQSILVKIAIEKFDLENFGQVH